MLIKQCPALRRLLESAKRTENLRRSADREGTPRPGCSVRLIAQAGVFFLLSQEDWLSLIRRLRCACVDSRYAVSSRLSRSMERKLAIHAFPSLMIRAIFIGEAVAAAVRRVGLSNPRQPDKCDRPCWRGGLRH